MATHFWTPAVRAGLALVASIVLVSCPPFRTGASAAAEWPSEVDAVYDITFNGFDIGDFRFKSKTGPEGYTLDGRSELSVFLGAFKWKGVFKASGSMDKDVPRPGGYTFDYKSGSKRGSVKMTFNEAGVSNVTLEPPKKPSRAAVPLEEHHLKNVLDPLSAIMVLTRSDGKNPCDRKLAVFDGKQRFDLVLSPRGTLVCRVEYRPVAGHKPNKENKALAEGDIEVALKPAQKGNLVVPHRITIPTDWGQAILTSKRIEIVATGQNRVADTDPR